MRDEYDFSKGKRGAVIPQKGKTRISIFIDNAVLDAFRARAEKAGTGYQTMRRRRAYASATAASAGDTSSGSAVSGALLAKPKSSTQTSGQSSAASIALPFACWKLTESTVTATVAPAVPPWPSEML